VVVVLSVLGHGTENNSITIPGTESQEVVDLLQAKIPAFSGAQTQVVFASPGSQDVTSSAYATDIKQAVAQVATVPQVASSPRAANTSSAASMRRCRLRAASARSRRGSAAALGSIRRLLDAKIGCAFLQ
jgi:RND superfamily putative drug exporter